MTKLPAPEQWVLARMNEMECAEMIEEHVDFIDDQGRSVHLQSPFVRHYLQRHDNALPTVVAITNMPIVMPSGTLLAPDGLDRLRGIIFKIPKELRAIIPEPEDCTPEVVAKEMDYLITKWMCDVKTDYAGKCTLIAIAMTIIERSLIPTRPAFFVTAGRRGGGKTTTLTMLIMAVIGIMPAAAAWSTDENERRKALLGYFLWGVPYILWDNIAKGSQIDCPHIERSCTSAYYSDRKLGVSEVVATAAAVVHLFTGNNISPRGDLSSRSLRVRLAVDRPDPENRTFEHPDIIGWTEDNRAEIMRALYTIMLGNPELKKPHDAPAKTRYKLWWRLVGSAIENAAKVTGHHDVDFQKLFIEQEEDDEDDASLADALVAIYYELLIGEKMTFKAKEVANVINDISELRGDARKANQDTLRKFFCPDLPTGSRASTISVGIELKKHVDGPVEQDGKIWTLKTVKERGGGGRSTTMYEINIRETENP